MMRLATAPLRRLVKSLSRWDRKSALEQALLRHRFLHAIAVLVSPLPLPIGPLLHWFGSDKHRPGFHAYGSLHQAKFRPLKYRRIKLVEIGIGDWPGAGGRSLLAWRAFFPFATIVGCDLLDKQGLARPGTRIRRMSQGSREDLLALLAAEAPFDIVIDDGSHLSEHQLLTFRVLFDGLKDGGLYVIEDVQTSYWPVKVGTAHWDGAAPDDPTFARTCMGFFLGLAKYLNHAEFLEGVAADSPYVPLMKRVRRITFEHNLIVVEKGRNEDPSILGLLRSL